MKTEKEGSRSEASDYKKLVMQINQIGENMARVATAIGSSPHLKQVHAAAISVLQSAPLKQFSANVDSFIRSEQFKELTKAASRLMDPNLGQLTAPTTGAGVTVREVLRGKTIIILSDETVWQISGTDSATTYSWLRLTKVTVRRASGAVGGFDFEIKGPNGKAVRAKRIA